MCAYKCVCVNMCVYIYGRAIIVGIFRVRLLLLSVHCVCVCVFLGGMGSEKVFANGMGFGGDCGKTKFPPLTDSWSD